MTKRLYLQDTYLFESKALIVATGQDEKGTYLLLDQTIFYPQGGGQPSDQGVIKGDDFEIKVSRVNLNENEIRHYLTDPINEKWVGSNVYCIIDQERRVLNARYHTAAHLLSHVVEIIYPKLKAVKGHSFPNEAYVEFQNTATDTEVIPDMTQVIDILQKVIEEGLTTKTFEMDPISFEEKYYKLPYEIPLTKVFRALQIGNYPPVPCGGTHLATTRELGNIELVKTKAKNDILRVSYRVN